MEKQDNGTPLSPPKLVWGVLAACISITDHMLLGKCTVVPTINETV